MQNGYSVTPGNSLPSYDEVLLQIWARSSRLPRYSSRALRRAQHHPYAHDRRRPDSDCVRNPAVSHLHQFFGIDACSMRCLTEIS